MADDHVIVVDGSNVAFEEQTNDGKPKVSNITKLNKALKEKGFKPIVIIDAALPHQIDDPDQLESFINDNTIHQAPAGTDADYFVLETAERYKSDVVSNDRYEPYQEKFPWIKKHRIPFIIVNGKVELYEPKM